MFSFKRQVLKCQNLLVLLSSGEYLHVVCRGGKTLPFSLGFLFFLFFINMAFNRDVYGKMIQDRVA